MAPPPLSPLEMALRAIAAELDGRGVGWALVGGLAVTARAEPRTTRDVDVAVSVRGDAESESLVLDLSSSGWGVVATVERDASGRLATVRLRPPHERRARGVVVDLLFASSGIEPEVVATAEPIEALPGLVVPVATLGHLVALKVLARDDRTRPRDAEDLRALLAEAGPSDLATARTALALVTERGFPREKRAPGGAGPGPRRLRPVVAGSASRGRDPEARQGRTRGTGFSQPFRRCPTGEGWRRMSLVRGSLLGRAAPATGASPAPAPPRRG